MSEYESFVCVCLRACVCAWCIVLCKLRFMLCKRGRMTVKESRITVIPRRIQIVNLKEGNYEYDERVLDVYISIRLINYSN